MASVVLMASVSVQPAKAQLAAEQPTEGLPPGVTPDITLPTEAHLSVRPNPVGLGQDILINIWLFPATAGSTRGKYLFGLDVIITKPDGTVIVVGPLETYASSSTWFDYTVDQVGNWTFEFDFPGNYWPAGRYLNGKVVTNSSGYNCPESVYYQPSSDGPLTIVVQEDFVLSWPASPLPTDYWTRPVFAQNREWQIIAGNWPWRGPGGPDFEELYPDCNTYYTPQYLFTPYVQAPESAHIVWRRQNELVGILSERSRDFSWGSPGFYPGVIYNGRAYSTYMKPATGTADQADVYWRCYDIRTGETIWEKPAPAIISQSFFGLSVNALVPDQITYESGGFFGGGTQGLLLYDERMYKFDLWSGEMTANVTTEPIDGGTYYREGYVLSVQNLGGGNYRLINWSTSGTSNNFANRIVSNISWPWNTLGRVDFETGITANSQSVSPSSVGLATNIYLQAASLTTGQQLWNISMGVPYGAFSGSTFVSDHGKTAIRMNDGTWYCHDLRDGTRLWTIAGSALSWPWGEFGTYNVASAYGKLISTQYDGIMAINWEDGTKAWEYLALAEFPLESPYTGPGGVGVMPFHVHCLIADGKLYISNGEHTATQPASRGFKLHCINMTNGEGIWSIMTGMSGLGSASRETQGAVADGYFIYNDLYTGFTSCYGKGKSVTTVTAPDTEVPLGTTVMIKGTVLDLSPAQPNTACVSVDSMKTQMEYLHLQMPINGIHNNETITGVPVTLYAIASDGSYVDIGTATSNGYYGSFGFAWTPPNEDTYEIVASFDGDASYASSGDATTLVVGAAAEPYPTPIASEEPVDNSGLLYGILAAVIVAIIIGLAALLFTLRK
jgi:hypothetical protein